MLAIPPGPVIIDRLALEDRQKHKYRAEQDIDNHGNPEQLTDAPGRKDAKVEEKQRKFEQGDLGTVEYRRDEEKAAEFSDRVKGNGPEVEAQAVGGCAVDVDNRIW